VVKVTPVKVNNFAIMKDTFGDLNSLNDREVKVVNECLALF